MIAARLWRVVPVVLALLCVPALLVAQQSDRLSGAEEMLARAESFGAKNDYDSAISLLQSALERYPSYPRLYFALANWQERRGTVTITGQDDSGTISTDRLMRSPDVAMDLFETFGLASLQLADTQEIRRRVNALVEKTFPVQLGSYGPLALPGLPTPFTYAVFDPRLPISQRGLEQGLITVQPLPVNETFARDPKYGRDAKYARDAKFGNWRFQQMLYAYSYDRNTQCWQLRFRVMWQDDPQQSFARRELAQMTAQMLVRLSGLLRAYTALTPRFADDGVVNVWLAAGGDPGAEAYNENIYLYAVDTPRSGAEWIRELAHEFGHQTLPPVGGYTQPEWAANGRLAERLLLRWAALNMDPATETHPWMTSLMPNTLPEQRNASVIRQFAEAGPEAQLLRGTDETAFDAFTGMALYLEQTRGSRFLTSALTGMTTPIYVGANGFLQSVENLELYVQSIDNPVVTLRVQELPQEIPYYLFLRDGTWQGEIFGRNLLPGSVGMTMDGTVVPVDAQGKFTLTNLPLGWHAFRVIPVGNNPAPTLTLLKFTRQ